MMNKLTKLSNVKSRSISAENFTGEKGRGGMAIEGTGKEPSRELGRGWKVSPSIIIAPGETFELANIKEPGVIKHIWMTAGTSEPRTLILRMYWDDSEKPSVEVPMTDFFAAGDSRYFRQMSSLAVCINPKNGYNSYWEMPFSKNCRITMENIFNKEIVLYYQIDYEIHEKIENPLYFHAQFRRTNPLPYKQEYVLLDNVEGNGHYVGTYLFWGVNNNGWWGEGEIKFYLDGDKEFPTICGTGTEDYFCGAYNFDVAQKYTEFCTSYSGLSKVILPDGLYKSNTRFAMYRWHIQDPIRFSKDIKVTIQALGWRSQGRYIPLQDDISSVSYWYQDSICQTFPKLPNSNDLEIV